MEAWLEIGGVRIILAVSDDTVKHIEDMSNQKRMDLRYEISSALKKIVDTLVNKVI